MIDTPEVTELPVRHTAVIRTKIPRSEVQNFMGAAFSELRKTVESQGRRRQGAWFARHFRIDPEFFDMEVGTIVDSPVVKEGRVEPGDLPGKKVARTVYHGSYEGLPEAWSQLETW